MNEMQLSQIVEQYSRKTRTGRRGGSGDAGAGLQNGLY